MRTGVARAQRGSRNHTLIQVHFLFLVQGTVTLGGLNATRWLIFNYPMSSLFFFFFCSVNLLLTFCVFGHLSLFACQGLQNAKRGIPFSQSFSSLIMALCPQASTKANAHFSGGTEIRHRRQGRQYWCCHFKIFSCSALVQCLKRFPLNNP